MCKCPSRAESTKPPNIPHAKAELPLPGLYRAAWRPEPQPCRLRCHKNFSLHVIFPGRTPGVGGFIRALAKWGGRLRAAPVDGMEGLQLLLHFPATISKAVLPAYVNIKSFIHRCVSQPAVRNAQPVWKENKLLPKIAALSLTASTSTQGRGRSRTGLEKGQGRGCRGRASREEDVFGKQKKSELVEILGFFFKWELPVKRGHIFQGRFPVVPYHWT